MLFAAAAVAFSQAPQPTASDCTVDGIVVNSITGEPIPRARIVFNSDPAASDSQGKWRLSHVACGAALLIATRPGFVPKESRALTLVSGSPIHDVKIELTPQSVFVGRVLDDQGDPVPGARINALAARVVDGRIGFYGINGAGSANDLGDYRIAGVPRGKYILCSNLPGAPTVAESCYPGPVQGGAASAMDVPAGRETRVDFALNQTPGVHIRGTISGVPEGRGAGVSLIKRGANTGFAGNSGTVDNGHFDIRAVPGSYILAADEFEEGKHLFARIPIEVGTSDIDNLAVTLDTGFTETGTVSISSQSGQAAAKPQFDIGLRSAELINVRLLAKWDADHTSFTFDGMTPDNAMLDLAPPAPFYVKSATVAGQDILNGEFALSQGGGPIEIVLNDDGGSIEGDVVDADGQPATGGVLALRNGGAVSAAAQTNGHFKIQNLAPGDYAVYAWDIPGEVAYADTDWMRHYGGTGVAATVTAGQNTQVKLTLQKVPQ